MGELVESLRERGPAGEVGTAVGVLAHSPASELEGASRALGTQQVEDADREDDVQPQVGARRLVSHEGRRARGHEVRVGRRPLLGEEVSVWDGTGDRLPGRHV